jgi:hypothetical protein
MWTPVTLAAELVVSFNQLAPVDGILTERNGVRDLVALRVCGGSLPGFRLSEFRGPSPRNKNESTDDSAAQNE